MTKVNNKNSNKLHFVVVGAYSHKCKCVRYYIKLLYICMKTSQ